jgi:hypothetical protein
MKNNRLFLYAILIFLPVCANATINSNSKMLDGIEYYVQTDKSTYELGEQVEMLYKITNLSEQSVTFTSPDSSIWNFWVERDGSQICQAVNARSHMVASFTLVPGQSCQFPSDSGPLLWPLHDGTSYIVSIGNYDIIGGLDGNADYLGYTKVSVPIVVTPEPATVLLLTLGGLVLRKHRR